MNNVNNSAANIKKINIFRNVYLQKIKNIRINKFQRIIRPKLTNIIGVNCEFLNKIYDNFLFCNPSLQNLMILKRLIKNNKLLRASLFEDGLATYSMHYYYLYDKNTRSITSKLNLNYLLRKVNEIYTFCPNAFVWTPNQNLIKIPSFLEDYKSCTSELNKIFDYFEDVIPEDCKTIFFEEGFFGDGKNVNDLEIVRTCIKKYGEEGFYVKTHPRNIINRFKNLNIKTLNTNSIPWELIVLNIYARINDLTLISISSACIFTPNLLLECTPKSISCLNLVNNKSLLFKDIPEVEEKFIEIYDNLKYYENDSEVEYENS